MVKSFKYFNTIPANKAEPKMYWSDRKDLKGCIFQIMYIEQSSIYCRLVQGQSTYAMQPNGLYRFDFINKQLNIVI